jgi:hypothetical protein
MVTLNLPYACQKVASQEWRIPPFCGEDWGNSGESLDVVNLPTGKNLGLFQMSSSDGGVPEHHAPCSVVCWGSENVHRHGIYFPGTSFNRSYASIQIKFGSACTISSTAFVSSTY